MVPILQNDHLIVHDPGTPPAKTQIAILVELNPKRIMCPSFIVLFTIIPSAYLQTVAFPGKSVELELVETKDNPVGALINISNIDVLPLGIHASKNREFVLFKLLFTECL